MTMNVTDTDNVKIITKPWGWEKWMQPGDDEHRYVLKQIYLKKGNRTSLQVHQLKSETIVILEGKGKIWTYKNRFDTDRYLKGLMSKKELEHVLDQVEAYDVTVNSVIHITSNTIHRMESIEDLLFFEASTTELDDVVRIQDDSQRGHGKIIEEHQVVK